MPPLPFYDLELVYVDGTFQVHKQTPQPHRIAQGVTVRLRYRVRTSSGVAVDLSLWDLTYTLKEDRDDATEIVSRSGTYVSPDDDRAGGIGSFIIDDVDTVTQLVPELLPRSGPYVADVRAETPAGPTQLLIASDVQLGPMIGEPGTVPTPPAVFAGQLVAGALKARAMAVTGIALTGLQTVDGVSLVDGDVCARNASPPDVDNGLYVVRTGAWERTGSFPAGAHGGGVLVVVREGTVYADTLWLSTNDATSDLIGTDDIAFAPTGGGSGSVVGVTGTAPISVDNTDPTNPIVEHDPSGVAPGSYTNTNLTVDADGHVTAAANGTGGSVPGRYTSTVQSVGATPTAFPDTVLVPDGAEASVYARIIARDVIGPNAGKRAEFIFRSVWRTDLGVTTQVGDDTLDSSTSDVEMDPEEGSLVQIYSSSPAPGIMQINIVGLAGETITWIAGP